MKETTTKHPTRQRIEIRFSLYKKNELPYFKKISYISKISKINQINEIKEKLKKSLFQKYQRNI